MQTLWQVASNAPGQYFKMDDGARIQVVGTAEDGKYTAKITEQPQLAMFLPILHSPSTEAWLVVRSSDDEQQLAAAIRTKLRDLDSGLPAFIQTWNEEMNGALFASRMAAASLGVPGTMGAILSVTGIFGLAAYSVNKRKRDLGIRMALGAQRKEVLKTALEARSQIACLLVRRWDYFWASRRAGCWLTSCIRQRRVICWCWRVLSSPWRCWDWWPRGFPHNARFRLTLRSRYAKSELALLTFGTFLPNAPRGATD